MSLFFVIASIFVKIILGCLPLKSLSGSTYVSMPKNSQRSDSVVEPENDCMISSVIPLILPLRKDSASVRDEVFLNNNDDKGNIVSELTFFASFIVLLYCNLLSAI